MVGTNAVAAATARPRTNARRWAVAGGALVLLATLVACRPLPLGGASRNLGNDVSNCPQFQPTATCSPPGQPAGSGQPMTWMAITGPYEAFSNGDPYNTKCGPAAVQPLNETNCSGVGANPSYRTTGSAYVVDVGPADIGEPMSLQIWDAATAVRNGSTTKSGVTRPAATNNRLQLPTGESWSGLVDRYVFGPSTPSCIPPGTYITGTIAGTSNRTVTLSQNITCDTTAAFSVAVGNASRFAGLVDCIATMTPFNAPPYNGTVGNQQCQTGDSGSSALQVQLFENDGVDDTIDFSTPINGCELYVPQNADRATYMNSWLTVCTFTPTQIGEYPLRIKSSAIVRPNGTVIPDAGSGYNAFSLRVAGGLTDTRLHADTDLSLWLNTPVQHAHVYLAEVTSEDAGKTMQFDLFDPGDGTSGEYTLQVLAPPSGTPAMVPNGGTVIPAPDLASSCRYNPVASPTRGPDVAAPAGADAPNCTVTTRAEGEPSGRYNNGWLSIEIRIDPNYTCSTDCWWTVKYDFGSAPSPTDRTVWSPFLIDGAAG